MLFSPNGSSRDALQAPAGSVFRRRQLLVWTAAGITFCSGALNLFSLIGRSLPYRVALLRDVFPLELLHFSRFLTLVTGFVLVVSSINIYKRKKRAYRIVMALAVCSVIFHMTKGLDYEEASFSLLLMATLYLARRHFTVKSSIPRLSGALLRLSLALLVALAYGVAGFWFLDQKEFGVNFTLSDSIWKTLLFFFLVPDPELVPMTRYAAWFLDSLYLMTVTAIGYSAFALFRPVIYQLRTHPRKHLEASRILATHGRSSLDFFKIGPDKSFFFSTSRKSFLSYGVSRGYALVLGDPVGPEEEIEYTVKKFREMCHDNDWAVGFYQTLPDFLPLYRRLNLRRLKIGDEAVVDLKNFNLEGKARKDFRHVINQMEKSGFRVRHFEPPIDEETFQRARQVSDDWLTIAGRRERSFSVGSFQERYVRSTSLVAVVDSRESILAFVNIIPSYTRGESTIDLMRRRRTAPNGIMEYLLLKLFLYLREKGFDRFSLGLAPMAGFRASEEPTPEERAVHFFFQRLNFYFSYKGLRDFKAKFAAGWEPRYVIYENVLDLPRLALCLVRLSESGKRI